MKKAREASRFHRIGKAETLTHGPVDLRLEDHGFKSDEIVRSEYFKPLETLRARAHQQGGGVK